MFATSMAKKLLSISNQWRNISCVRRFECFPTNYAPDHFLGAIAFCQFLANLGFSAFKSKIVFASF